MIYPSKEFIELFKSTPGAISVAESIAIINVAAQAPEGVYAEAGSHKGKSGMSAAYSLKQGDFYLIDPIYEDKIIERAVIDALYKVTSKLNVIPCADISVNELPKHKEYSYVFVDSDQHTEELIKAELDIIVPKMVPGGIIAFHDWNNQFIAPKQAGMALVATGEFELVEIDWDAIFNFVRDGDLENGNNSWHEKGSNEFPCYVGAVRKKTL